LTRFHILAAAAALVTSPLSAQGLDADRASDLATLMADTGPAEPYLTCGGIFRAIAFLAGDDTELGQSAIEQEIRMAAAGGPLLETTRGTSPEVTFEALVDTIDAAVQVFASQMIATHDATGQPLDDALAARLDDCLALAGTVPAP
jgi:hypothetical protein